MLEVSKNKIRVVLEDSLVFVDIYGKTSPSLIINKGEGVFYTGVEKFAVSFNTINIVVSSVSQIPKNFCSDFEVEKMELLLNNDFRLAVKHQSKSKKHKKKAIGGSTSFLIIPQGEGAVYYKFKKPKSTNIIVFTYYTGKDIEKMLKDIQTDIFNNTIEDNFLAQDRDFVT
jgi:hypothetical protein